MARQRRLIALGHPHYILQRVLPGVIAFPTDADIQKYLDALRRLAAEFRVSVHAYAVLADQVQLLATPHSEKGLSLLMQSMGRGYVASLNRGTGRVGALWDGRFRAAPVEAPMHLVDLMLYVEGTPVRQGLVLAAQDHPGSSAAHHAGVCQSALITDHPVFWALGNTPFEREANYVRLLNDGLSREVVAAIEAKAAKGWAMGSERFLSEVASSIGRRVTKRSPGRPKKTAN